MTIGEIITTPEEWHVRFLDMANLAASWSKDPDRKVGAVIVDGNRRVVAMGYNGFPRGVTDLKTRMKSVDEKLALSVHAELNAILNATTSVAGCILYVNSFPCHECAKAIVQAGLGLVVAPQPRGGSSWQESWKWSTEILSEGGVSVWRVEDDPGE